MRASVLPSALMVAALLLLGGPPAEARSRRPKKPIVKKPVVKRPKVDKSLYLIVQQVPPKPPKKGAKPPKPQPYGYRYGSAGASRTSTTLYLRSTPGGSVVTQLPTGVKMRVLSRGKTHSKVETGGLIKVSGYVPNVVLGLRVLSKTKLYAKAGGKSIGEIGQGQLVHVEKRGATYSQVQVLGYLPLRCYIKTQDLGVTPTSYGGYLRGGYPGGSQMNVAKGSLHASPNGPVIAQAIDEGKVYRVRVMGKWSQVAMYDYSRVQLRGWVLTERLSWRNSPWYGNGYRQNNCTAGGSGSQVALSGFKLYAQLDDAWPSIRVLPNARFDVYPQKNGWVRISSYGCLSFNGYAEDRAGDWTSAYLLHRLTR